MKVNRNYRFVLTNIPNSMLETGEIRIDSCAITGERMFASECHYYAEKNILECLKEADKRNDLSGYYGHTYCIYKENKPKRKQPNVRRTARKLSKREKYRERQCCSK